MAALDALRGCYNVTEHYKDDMQEQHLLLFVLEALQNLCIYI